MTNDRTGVTRRREGPHQTHADEEHNGEETNHDSYQTRVIIS
jgi:hypothetical protein